MTDPLSIFDADDGVNQLLALLTGVRQKLIDLGWTPVNAEALVVEWYRALNAASTRATAP